jgi:hypothetical protein
MEDFLILQKQNSKPYCKGSCKNKKLANIG